MIEIDAGYGSGGGQVLRTAIGLSALTGLEVRLYNIRAKRPQPGLKEQHLRALLGVAEICGGKVEGASLGSRQITFYPGELKPGIYKFHISTAGSVTLFLQAILLPALKGRFSIEIKGGGTFGKWAPPFPYYEDILFPFLERMGYPVQGRVLREGFYPKGGAHLFIETQPASLQPLFLPEKGSLKEIKCLSIATRDLSTAKVAERQAKAFKKLLLEKGLPEPKLMIKYVSASSTGSAICAVAVTEHSLIGANSLGEKGKRAEIVGRECADKLLEELKGAVDSHAGDQLLPYLALTGGEILVSRVTDHLLTNAWVIEKFLPVKIEIKGRKVRIIKNA